MMAYTNSNLVVYTRLSPNHSGQRTHIIDRITPHCVVGQCAAESLGEWFAQPDSQASSNYGIDKDGRVALYVEEKNRSWCSSSNANDQRAVTIECASDTVEPYAINDKVYQKLIDLMTDICKRNGKTKLIWFGDKNKSLDYEPKADEMIITVHRWFANKSCPGDYIYNRLGTIAQIVTSRLGDETEDTAKWYRIRTTWTNIASQIGAYKDINLARQNCPIGYSVFDYNGNVVYAPKSKQVFIDEVADIAKSLCVKTNIIPSVVIAQCCLETGYGMGADAAELMKHNNLLGMKAELLNHTWKDYSVWNGETFSKITPEVYNGITHYITDTFRVYKDYENCIKDYEMFLLHVKSSGEYKYRKIIGVTNPKDVITIISKGGYATDPNYITKILDIIKEDNLTKYDEEVGVTEEISLEPQTMPEVLESGYYRVQVGSFSKKSYANKFARTVNKAGFATTIKEGDYLYKIQVGAYRNLANAKKKLAEVKAAGFTDAYITS